MDPTAYPELVQSLKEKNCSHVRTYVMTWDSIPDPAAQGGKKREVELEVWFCTRNLGEYHLVHHLRDDSAFLYTIFAAKP